jgi:hypothetical protein
MIMNPFKAEADVTVKCMTFLEAWHQTESYHSLQWLQERTRLLENNKLKK